MAQGGLKGSNSRCIATIAPSSARGAQQGPELHWGGGLDRGKSDASPLASPTAAGTIMIQEQQEDCIECTEITLPELKQ